jgi:hypothetical protein
MIAVNSWAEFRSILAARSREKRIRFDYAPIDKYQDLNVQQARFLTVFGDTKKTVYFFRAI